MTWTAVAKRSIHGFSGRIWRKLEILVSSKVFLVITIFWFILEVLYFAVGTTYGIAPDETYHFDFIKLFAQQGWLPTISDQSGYYHLGEVQKTPFFLYHYLLSIPYHLVQHSNHAVVFLRLINICFSLGTLYFIYKLLKYLKISPFIRNLSLFMLTNTLMFVFLCSSINYDNLFLLVTTATFYVYWRLRDTVSAPYLLAYLCLICTGSLIKSSYLPIAFVTACLLLIHYRNRLGSIGKPLKESLRRHPVVSSVLAVPLLFMIILCTQHYIVNLVDYHAVTPACASVNTEQQCLQNSNYKRSYIFAHGYVPPTHTSGYSYLTSWSEIMRQRIFGILGHQSLTNSLFISFWSEVLIIMGAVAIIRTYRLKDEHFSIFMLISLVYIVSLVQVNYATYKSTGYIAMGVQGRYIFAVLPFLYVLLNFYILRFLRISGARAAYTIITLFVFAFACLPAFFVFSNSSWYSGKAAGASDWVHAKAASIYTRLTGVDPTQQNQ